MCLFYGTLAGQFDFRSVAPHCMLSSCRPKGSAVSKGFILPRCVGEATFRICVSRFNCSWRQCLPARQECVITLLRRKRLRMDEYDVAQIAW